MRSIFFGVVIMVDFLSETSTASALKMKLEIREKAYWINGTYTHV